MSEELVLLKEYAESLGLIGKELTHDDLVDLKQELRDAGEMGLANFISALGGPKELEDYLVEEE